ncbi:hypothetical protein PMIN03_013006 [Paraphaeosphaeria minitans]
MTSVDSDPTMDSKPSQRMAPSSSLRTDWTRAGPIKAARTSLTFIDMIRQQIENNLCVNEKLSFSPGFSYGGAMSFSLACSRAKDFRAIAVLSGGLFYLDALSKIYITSIARETRPQSLGESQMTWCDGLSQTGMSHSQTHFPIDLYVGLWLIDRKNDHTCS